MEGTRARPLSINNFHLDISGSLDLDAATRRMNCGSSTKAVTRGGIFDSCQVGMAKILNLSPKQIATMLADKKVLDIGGGGAGLHYDLANINEKSKGKIGLPEELIIGDLIYSVRDGWKAVEKALKAYHGKNITQRRKGRNGKVTTKKVLRLPDYFKNAGIPNTIGLDWNQKFPFGDGYFDFAFLISPERLQDVSDVQQRGIPEMIRVLKEGGKGFFATSASRLPRMSYEGVGSQKYIDRTLASSGDGKPVSMTVLELTK